MFDHRPSFTCEDVTRGSLREAHDGGAHWWGVRGCETPGGEEDHDGEGGELSEDRQSTAPETFDEEPLRQRFAPHP